MPVRELLNTNPAVFGPDQIREITAAFEAILKDLGLKDRTDPVTTMVARLTFELAQQGKFTAGQLRKRVMQEMQRGG